MKRLLIVFIAFAGILSSCYKAPENGIAKITILNAAFRQPGVDVQLVGPAGSYIDEHFITDLNGEVIYEHDPALEVILNVHATYTDPIGLHEAHGLIRIKPDHTVNETYTLTP